MLTLDQGPKGQLELEIPDILEIQQVKSALPTGPANRPGAFI